MEKDYLNWKSASELLAMDHIGGSSTVVEVRGRVEGIFQEGTYEECGKIRDAKFFARACKSEDDESYCHRIVTLSRRVNSSYVLAPVVVTKSYDGTKIYMGYKFDQADVRDNNIPVFVNGIMNKHWRKQVRHLLTTIKDMHDAGVYHGGLNNIHNYVYRAKMIRIINPFRDVEDGKTVGQIARLKEDDIQGFLQFLLQVLHCSITADLHSFYTLFITQNVDNKLQCLINHPVLKDSNQKMMYFDNWYDCCMPKRSYPFRIVTRFESELSTSLSVFAGWNRCLFGIYANRLTDPTSGTDPNKTNPNKTVGQYKTTDLLDLLRFIRNESKHLVKDKLRTSEQIEKDLQTMYPGLISHIHNCVAKLNSSYYGVVREPEI